MTTNNAAIHLNRKKNNAAREILITAEELTSTSKRYIKGRNLHKMRSPLILEIIKNFNVTETISEAICGSIDKAGKLSLKFESKNKAFVQDAIKDGKLSYIEIFVLTNKGCSCKKQIQIGLPCSHYIRFLQEKGENIFETIHIADRWIDQIINVPTYKVPTPVKFVEKTIVKTPSDEKERFIILRSRLMPLAVRGAQTQRDYEMVSQLISELEIKYKTPNSIIDDVAKRPGRPKKQVNYANDKSKIKKIFYKIIIKILFNIYIIFQI